MLTTSSGSSCELCNSKCMECAGSANSCTACDTSKFREFSGTPTPGVFTCACITGYEEFEGACVDTRCNTVDPFCQTCLYNFPTQESDCLTCVSNRAVISGLCRCNTGFYEAANKDCVACKPGCQFCTAANQCTSCAIKSIPQADGSCLCPAGTVLSKTAGTLYCKDCSPTCATCEGSIATCKTCKTGFVLNTNKQCVCPEGSVLPVGQSNCQPCLSNCLLCSSLTSCQTCAAGFVWNSQSQRCDLNCAAGQYNAGSTCEACPSNCAGCVNPFNCIACKSPSVLFAGSCRENCPTGTFASNGRCFVCDPNCKTCQGSSTKCTDCNSGLIFFQDKCVTDCPAGTYFGQGSCLACSATCATCMGSASNCVSCLSGQFFYSSTCFATCPVAIVEGVCTNVCPDGTFLSDKACLPCDNSCQTCLGAATFCKACTSGFFGYQGKCIS